MRAAKKYAESDENTVGDRRPQRPRRALNDITNASNQIPTGVSTAKRATGLNGLLPVPLPAVTQQTTTVEATENVLLMMEDDRPYMQREADDIDSRDAENPMLCSQYVNQMYEFFKMKEREMMVNPSYIHQQTLINDKMRCILFDWLVEVHLKFKMVPETLYLTVNIVDRYLENNQVRRSKLQLVGVAALLLASKYEEIYPPELPDLVFITDRAYTQKEIIEMETIIAGSLNYDLTVPTIHTFLCRYLKAAHADRTMVQMACYLAERTLQEYSMVKFLPSVIAATAVHAARISLRRHPWSPTLVKYTSYDECDLEACSQEMRAYMNDTEPSAQTAVSRKYSSPKFGAVARMAVTI